MVSSQEKYLKWDSQCTLVHDLEVTNGRLHRIAQKKNDQCKKWKHAYHEIVSTVSNNCKLWESGHHIPVSELGHFRWLVRAHHAVRLSGRIHTAEIISTVKCHNFTIAMRYIIWHNSNREPTLTCSSCCRAKLAAPIQALYAASASTACKLFHNNSDLTRNK